jgi:uncharacterized protein with FMN-binding domain
MDQSLLPILQALGRAARKLFLSAFVIFTFIVYAVHERFAGSDSTVADALPASPHPTATQRAATAPAATAPPTRAPSSTDAGAAAQPTQTALAATSTDSPAATSEPAATAVPPTDVPATPVPATGQYKDGTYTGPTVNAFYGYVQVEADVQNGQLTDVKFLQYPSDRRTSQRINNVAMPWLTSEAIQAQSANVDIVSGATLTSEAFARSLPGARLSAAP